MPANAQLRAGMRPGALSPQTQSPPPYLGEEVEK